MEKPTAHPIESEYRRVTRGFGILFLAALVLLGAIVLWRGLRQRGSDQAEASQEATWVSTAVPSNASA